jgi:hypothetical protein
MFFSQKKKDHRTVFYKGDSGLSGSAEAKNSLLLILIPRRPILAVFCYCRM